MVINENLTTVNRRTGSNKVNQYVVIHYTANDGDTAYGNTQYFKSVYRDSSANYFVDKYSIWKCVKDSDIAWHCGTTGTYYHPKCRNSNSVGVEMCSVIKDGVYVIPEETVNNTVYIARRLMDGYNIPIENVIRHYDVTHKDCPEPFVRDISQWEHFKNELVTTATHWCYNIMYDLYGKNVITDISQWKLYDESISKAMFMAITDKATGGTWGTDEDTSDHWARANLISLCGKNIIKDKSQWEDFDTNITKALALAITDNATGGTLDKYKNQENDHWARACLNSLCDKNICTTVSSWVDHWEEPLSKAECMALVYKAYFS